VPSPGIEGGLSAKTKPSLIWANCAFSRGSTPKVSCDGSVRTSNGFIDGKKIAALLRNVPSIRL
jgi:hypothetical protein